MTSIMNIKHVSDVYELIKYLTKTHLKSTPEDQYHIEVEIEGILNDVQTRVMPHIGSQYASKRDTFRANHEFNKGDLIKVVSITIGMKETILVVDFKGRSININLDQFYKIFKRQE